MSLPPNLTHSLGPQTKKEALSPYKQGLPTHFVRVGRRGITWELPRRFQGYQATATHLMSIGGAATKCFLSRNGSLDSAYIAKFAHKNDAIETYTELFNNQLGQRLKFDMAHSGIAKLDGVLHFLSRSFRTDPAEQLLHGSLLVEAIGLANQTELDCINTAARQQDIFDIDFVRAVIYEVCTADADKVFAALVEMLMFDALIGSMDRHPRNWGVLRTATEPVQYSFSPLYDSARALLWEKRDDKLEALENSPEEFRRYIQRFRPRIGLPSSAGHKGQCTHIDLIQYLLMTHREVTLSAYAKIQIDVQRVAKGLLQQYPFRRAFSRLRARLILRLLVERQQLLLHLIPT